MHGDVFRPPQSASTLATFVGTGVQLFGMSLVTMIFALLGFLSPANRGGLMTAMLMMFVFMGLFAGYFSARLYKSFRGEEWKKTTLRTALLFPGACSFGWCVCVCVWGGGGGDADGGGGRKEGLFVCRMSKCAMQCVPACMCGCMGSIAAYMGVPIHSRVCQRTGVDSLEQLGVQLQKRGSPHECAKGQM